MPVFTSGVQGQTTQTQQRRIVMETGSAPGESLLLAPTTEAATMSLTTQPNTISATTGMHLHFYIQGNTTAGTIVITGTGPSGSITSITYHVAIAPQNAQGFTEFTTKEAFLTVSASGIACTTLTGASIWVYGTFAGKFLIPAVGDEEEKIKHHTPEDKRGILADGLRVVQLLKEVDVSKLDSDLYPDSLWAYYMAISNTPTVTTVPSVGTSLLASTLIAATMTLTTPPSTPGQFLVFAISTNTASGTIVVNGTDQYGQAYTSSETITFTNAATQTVYSSRRYSAVNTSGANTFTTTGGASAHIVVTGVYAWQYKYLWDGINNITPYSAAMEVFDGVQGVVLPGIVLSELDLTYNKEKQLTLATKGGAQDFLIVGDPTSTTVGTNPFPTISQPTSLPMISWPASFYIDAATATPPSQQDGTMLDYKFALSTGRKWNYAGDGQQRPAYVTWDSVPKFAVDATIIWQNYQNYINYFKPNTALILTTQFQGTWLGNLSSTNYWEQVTITAPCKIDTYKRDTSKNPLQGVLKIIPQYDFTNLAASYIVTIVSQTPPTYTA